MPLPTGERLATLEANMVIVLAEVQSIRSTQLEIRDAMIGARAVGAFARGVLPLVRTVVLPALSAAGAFLAMHHGYLPRS